MYSGYLGTVPYSTAPRQCWRQIDKYSDEQVYHSNQHNKFTEGREKRPPLTNSIRKNDTRTTYTEDDDKKWDFA